MIKDDGEIEYGQMSNGNDFVTQHGTVVRKVSDR